MILTKELKEHYVTLWNKASIRPEHLHEVNDIVDVILKNKSKYLEVEKNTSVPWFIVAVIHSLEGSLSFKTWLANGDQLSAPTRNVPAGLGRGKKFPISWADGATISIKHDKLDQYKDWGTISGCCFRLETWNGTGYLTKHKNVNTPYLYSYTQFFTKGKYVSDGKFSATATSKQAGAVAILKVLHDKGEFVFGEEHDKEIEVEVVELPEIIGDE
jgi:lysozyme family protein